MSNTIRGKFRCDAVTFHGDPENTDTPRTYELRAVYDNGTPENARFAKATPWGELKMKIDNPPARLVTGVEYYMDLTPVLEAYALPDLKADTAEEKAETSAIPGTAATNWAAHEGMGAVEAAHVGE